MLMFPLNISTDLSVQIPTVIVGAQKPSMLSVKPALYTYITHGLLLTNRTDFRESRMF